MKSKLFILLFFLPVFPSICQQIKLENIDVREVIVDDTLSINFLS